MLTYQLGGLALLEFVGLDFLYCYLIDFSF